MTVIQEFSVPLEYPLQAYFLLDSRASTTVLKLFESSNAYRLRTENELLEAKKKQKKPVYNVLHPCLLLT